MNDEAESFLGVKEDSHKRSAPSNASPEKKFLIWILSIACVFAMALVIRTNLEGPHGIWVYVRLRTPMPRYQVVQTLTKMMPWGVEDVQAFPVDDSLQRIEGVGMDNPTDHYEILCKSTWRSKEAVIDCLQHQLFILKVN